MNLKHILVILPLISCLCMPVTVWAQVEAETGGVGSVEERRIIAAIEERKEQFRKKEEALQLRETELSSLSLELDRKLADMQDLRNEIAGLLKEKSTAETERIKTLSKMYEKMDKAKAAKLLADIEWNLSMAILSEIKTKIRGKIISQMDPQYAIRYTQAYSTLEKD